MKPYKIIGILLLATAWISVSEFVRNNLILQTNWNQYYEQLGLLFPSSTLNNIMWCVWSFCLALAIYIIQKRFNLLQTTLLTWLVAFVMMWITIGNLNVLPYSTLIFAIPLSLLEIFIAAYIIRTLDYSKKPKKKNKDEETE
ncbi:MAG TPA: hypothetical protein DCF91_08030 [Porphyromonadaceae bacterium]|nr:hypothetical protein [Porphyromonadaceae bacterium]